MHEVNAAYITSSALNGMVLTDADRVIWVIIKISKCIFSRQFQFLPAKLEIWWTGS